MRLTDQQIRATVAAMRMDENDKAILLARALAGEPEARFVVFAARRRTA